MSFDCCPFLLPIHLNCNESRRVFLFMWYLCFVYVSGIGEFISMCFYIVYLMRWWSGVLLRMSGCWWLPLELWMLLLMVFTPCDELNVWLWWELRVCEWELRVCVPCELSVLCAVVPVADETCGRDLKIVTKWKRGMSKLLCWLMF